MNKINFNKVVKIKFNGIKQKVEILTAVNKIKKGDFCTMPLLESNSLCYSTTLQIFVNKIKNHNWRIPSGFLMPAQSIDETPSDEHTTRIYLRPI